MKMEGVRTRESWLRGFRRTVWVLPALLAVALAPARVHAQQTSGLTKADIVRLLARPSTSQSEIAATIRQRCLTFQPTENDLADFRRLGATQTVLDAVQACEQQRGGGTPPATPSRPRPSGAQPAARAPAPAQLRLVVDSARVAAGSNVTIPVQVQRDGNPVAGVGVVARGSGALPGAGGSDATAVTGQDGMARLSFAGPGSAGRYRVQVEPTGPEARGGGTFSITVVAGASRTVVVQPERLHLAQGGLDTLSVSVIVHDAAGNGVTGAQVRLRKSESGGREVSWRSTTGSFGLADFRLPADLLRGGDTLSVLVGESVLASLPVSGAREARGPAHTDSVSAELARGQKLLDAGQTGEAAEIFNRLVSQDPGNADALIGLGQALVAQGSPDQAASDFREALRVDPGRVEALDGLARIAQDRGDARQAAEWLRSAAEHRPADAGAWTELGTQYLAAGEARQARDAFERALVLDPGSSEARAGLRRVREAVRRPAPYAEGFLWGGKTTTAPGGLNGRNAGFRRGGLTVWPTPDVRLRGYYDNMLLLDHPGLVRGDVDVRGVWGDARFTYGSTKQFSTLVGYGRRGQPPYDVGENVFEAAQTLRVGSGLGDFDRVSLRLGGLVGDWYDRTDYLVTTSIGIPVTGIVRLEPSFSYGETVGTVAFQQRYAAKEGRFTLGALFRGSSGWEVHPTISYGDVTAVADTAAAAPAVDAEALSGGLFDTTLEVLVPLGRYGGVRGFFRYQSPPGLPHFTQFGLGLVGLVPR